MNTKALKFLAHALVFMMIVELAVMNINISAFSIETISLAEMDRLKCQSVKWIKKEQNRDGSFGDNIQLYETSRILENLAYEESLADEKEKALQWLKKSETKSNDDIFRKLLAITQNNKLVNKNQEEIEFAELQNKDGGFGISKDYKSDVLDTILAVECMEKSEKDNSEKITKAVNYLNLCQNEDGGFAFSGEKSSSYLTALVYRVIKGNTASFNKAGKEILKKCREYIDSNEKDNTLWGIDNETIKNSLMCSLALVEDNDDTLNRISVISNKVAEDGSLFEDAELTSLYISLVNEYEEVAGKLNTGNVLIKGIKISSDKERIGAYSEVKITPDIIGMKDNYKVIVVVSGKQGYSQMLNTEGNNTYLWNTENNIGTFEVLVSIVDNIKGEVIASRLKAVEVLETFEVQSVNSNISPKAYKINSGKKIIIQPSAYVLSNVSDEITAEVSIIGDNEKVLYKAEDKKIGGENLKEVIFDDFTYVPDIKDTTIVRVQTKILRKGVEQKTKNNYVKIYSSTDENRIDIDYKVSSNFIDTTTDNINVDFSLSGKGLSETIKRKPMDIMIMLDSSGSMSKEDWKKAVDGAKLIIDNKQPEDRVAMFDVTLNRYIGDFTNNEKEINWGLERAYGKEPNGGTFTYYAINYFSGFFDEDDRDRVIYLFTDGTRSQGIDSKTLDEDKIRGKNINIYGVYLENDYSMEKIEEARETMEYITEVGGGRWVNSKDNGEIISSVRELLGDIFKMAGRNVKLSMTLENDIPFSKISFDNKPDEVIKNEDGTTTVIYNRNYLRVGEDRNLDIKYDISNMFFEKDINLIKDIKFSYVDENDENIEINLDDIKIGVSNNKSSAIPDIKNEDESEDESTVKIEKKEGNSILSHNKPEETIMDENKGQVTGKMSLSDNRVYVGDDITADINLTDYNNLEKKKTNTRIVLINKDDANRIYITDGEMELAGSNEAGEKITVKTKSYEEGSYIAIYMAEINGEMTALDVAGIDILEHIYILKVTAGTGGNVEDKSGEYKKNKVVTLNAKANKGYVFDKWVSEDISLDINQVNSSQINIVMPDKGVRIKAVFVKEKNAGRGKDDKNTVKDNKNKEETANKRGGSKTDLNHSNKAKNNVASIDNRSVKEEKESESAKYMENGKSILSPTTGDFITRDNIRIMILIQCIALIIICVALKKNNRKEQEGVQ